MMKRYLSLDLLRGISIFGMVFSATVPHGNLPAWMYHIQNPPPTHALDMTISGLSWVDLVFPIFIFCMGVAIPIANNRRIGKNQEKGAANLFIAATLERFIMLWLFSYLYVFLSYSNINDWRAQLLTIAGFAALFFIYMIANKRSIGIKVAGLILACGIITIGHYAFGEVISVQRRGIIIFLLAFIYLFGSLIWYFTRGSWLKRTISILVILAVTIITQQLDIPAKAYADPSIKWWFNPEYIYFLLILLPATMIGEHLIARGKTEITDVMEATREKKATKTTEMTGTIVTEQVTETRKVTEAMKNGAKSPANQNKMFQAMYALFVFAIVFWLVFAFYQRVYILNLIVTILSCTALFFVTRKYFPQYRYMILSAAILLALGFIFEPLDGGIKKVPCTISYCFVTCAISIMLLIVCDYICNISPKGFLTKIFTGAGSNPLISYVAFDNLVVPVMKLTGFITIYRAAYPDGMPWIGTLRACIITLITMWIVSLISPFGRRNMRGNF